MLNKQYDVIIVGAGLGGLYLANLLNKTKLRVLLIEKRNTITTLTKNYFGTFLEDVQKHNLEKYVLQQCGWGMYSTKHKYFNNLTGRTLNVLEMNSWAKSLKLNCDIKTDTEIIDIRLKKNESLSVLDQNYQEYNAKIIVDASGIAQTISGLLNIKKSKIDFLNYTYIMEGHTLKNKKEMFYFQDATLTNCGGWFHTLEDGRCLVGCAEYTVPHSLGPNELKKRLDSYIKNFHPLKKYLKNATITEELCMAGPTTTAHSSVVEDNYLAIGDAAGAGGPFIGDGFRMALAMADSAYDTIQSAFAKNDFSKKTLLKHSHNFKNEFSKWYKWSYLFRFIYVRYLTNKELNLLPNILKKKISDDDYYAILRSKFTPRILLKLFTPKLTILILKNMFIYHILQPIGITKLNTRPDVLIKENLN
jgi:flavin-dependent dehydrogenase